MKRFILMFMLSIPLFCYSQIRFATNYFAEGFWGDWKQSYDVISLTQGGFVIHSPHSHPSEWYAKISFNPDMNEERSKYRYKNNIPQEVPCEIVFRHSQSVTDIKKLMTLNYMSGNMESTFNGIIRIAPHKPKKKSLNNFIILVDKYGLAISLINNSIVYK